jgi:hypothetical protein
VSKNVNVFRYGKVEAAVGLAGGTLVIVAAVARQAWLDRHFLPSFVVSRDWYVWIETAVRVLVGATGVLALVWRRRIATIAVENRIQLTRIAVAVIAAVIAAEAALRLVSVRPGEWLLPGEEPQRRADAALGWTLVPGRTGHLEIGGRNVEYAVNRDGYRTRSANDVVDFTAPMLIFSGESIIFGEGLTFDETIPAQTAAMVGVRAVNLGVNGYSSDQAFLRLRQELPRFQKPSAIVSIFMPVLFGRNLDDDRPRLGPGLTWMPATRHARLVSLARLFVPYRSDEQVARGIALTQDVLRATADLARARGARSLLIVPHLGAEDQTEADLRRRVLDEGGIPYIAVPLDENWKIAPSDPHPDARGARAIADAIAAACSSAGGCR